MANWLGTVTNIGNDLLTAWTAGTTMTFDDTWASAGTVEEISLMAQTDLTGQKRPAYILSAAKVAEGFRVKVRIYAGDEAYPLRQIGVWAHITDGPSVLMAIFQRAREGVPIPSAADTPDFVYTISLLIKCSNTGQWTVTLDPSILVTRSDVAAALEHVDPVIVVRSRQRDPNKPDYTQGGGGGGEGEDVSVALEIGPFTGTAPITAVISGDEYDAHNVRTNGDGSPDGTIIVKEE